MAIIIAISHGKGGVCKTTTSVNLTGALRESGINAGLWDYDKDKPDAFKWAERSKEISWILKKDNGTDVIDYINDLSSKYEVILIDTSPNYAKHAYEAIIASDLVIIPTSTSFLDQDNTKDALGVPKLARKPFKLLMSKVKKSTKEGKKILSQVSGKDIAFSTVITDRNVIAKCPESGKWIGDFAKNSDSHKQYLSLAQEVLEWIKVCDMSYKMKIAEEA